MQYLFEKMAKLAVFSYILCMIACGYCKTLCVFVKLLHFDSTTTCLLYDY